MLFVLLLPGVCPLFAQDDDPLHLRFQRLAVRRFIFSGNLVLNEFIPAETVAFSSMYPAFSVSESGEAASDEAFRPKIESGQWVLDATCGTGPATVYMGGINPYATYDLEIAAYSGESETGLEFARFGLRDRVQVVANLKDKVSVRIVQNNRLLRETGFACTFPPDGFSLKVQLYGSTLGVFLTENGETRYIGHLPVKEHFGDVLDFRKPETGLQSTFNLISDLKAEVRIRKVSSFLSPGIGQADIRPVSYEDLSPYLEDGRLWFTFSCRGLDTPQSVQGVLSVNPSVFDVRFEGIIVFDHGDGLLRNDYAAHLFYDRYVQEWRALACDFGGSAGKEGRAATGLVTAVSRHDPRRGFSVMKASRIAPEMLDGKNEDPCIFYDDSVGKWRLLTSAFVKGNITARLYESEAWNGPFTGITPPIEQNSTGTSLQKIGGKVYALMGGKENLRVHSYPGLQELGELKLYLQPHWPKPAGRIWAGVVPLPEGYPYRYVLLTMDRPNFPGVKGANWSYGALYFYGGAAGAFIF
jgi:hypothetical protein